ncbi:VWA domain-containing protein, partial [Vibrio sp. 10N.239.312.D08]|uniref:VWA domain-containing protein n=1 Tax=Vibrio sp. 10N.239.312.D08 TaxID=3229978 RepID=UPI0035508750
DTSDGENQQGDTGESQQGQSGEDKQGDTSSGENQQSQSSSTQGGDQGQLGNQNSAQPFSQQQSGASSNKSNQQNQNIDENDIQALTPEKISQIQKDAGNKSDSLAQTLAQKALKELDASANNESIETCKNLEMRDNGKRFSFVREMRQLEGAIRRPLQAMLLAQTWRNESFGRKGELDTSRIHRVVTDGKAMRQETIIEGENSAVSILVDASTSMDDKAVKGNPFSLSRMQVAEITVGAMTNVLSSLNIPVEAWKFASSSSTGPAVSAYKLFNEKPNQMMGKLGRAPKGGTPTGEALFTIIANISKRHEPKKIVYVITDGEANKGGVMLKKAYEMSEAVGVKVKFICVGTKWKYHFAQEFVAEIEQATELPRLMQRMSLKDL